MNKERIEMLLKMANEHGAKIVLQPENDTRLVVFQNEKQLDRFVAEVQAQTLGVTVKDLLGVIDGFVKRSEA